MYTQERINEICEALNLEKDEVKIIEETHWMNQSFSSIKFYFILHLSNSEIFYLDDCEEKSLKEGAAKIVETLKGIVIAYK